MPLGPVVAGPGLPEHEVVGAEDLTEGAGPHAVRGVGLEVHQHGAGHVLAAARLVVVHIDDLLELGPDLAAAPAGRVGEHVVVAGADEILLADVGVPPVVGAGALQHQWQRQRVQAALDVAVAVGEDEPGHKLLLFSSVLVIIN